MPLREEGMSLRLVADSASLKSGRREVQEWTKQVNELSKRIKTGLGTKEDFARLKEHQQSASQNYKDLQTKLEAYTRQRENYLRQIGEAPTAGLRKVAGIRERDVRGMMRDIAGQQARLGGLGEAAGAGLGGAPAAGGGFRRGVAGALGMARRVPVVGGLLGAAGLAAGIFSATRYAMELDKSTARVALSFARADESAASLSERIKDLGADRGFAPDVRIQAQAAGIAAGGRGMMGVMPQMAEYALKRGMDLPVLAAMMGQGVRGAGAFRPSGVGGFLMRMEGARLAAPDAARMSTQQYMQTVLPFLQGQGKFQAYTGSSEDAVNTLYRGLMRPGISDTGADFINRSIGPMVGALSQAIRAPQGEAAQFFGMRALGLGEAGVSYYDVLRRQEQGLTAGNLQAFVGRARRLAQQYRGGSMEPQQVFALAMRNLTGRNIPLQLGEELYGADLTSDKTLRDSLTKKGKDEFEALIVPPEAQAALDTAERMKEISEKIGDLIDNTLPAIATGLGGIVTAINFWGDFFTGGEQRERGPLLMVKHGQPVYGPAPEKTTTDVEPR